MHSIWKTERPRPLWRHLTPPQAFIASFLGLITVGTAGLLALPDFYVGDHLGFVDALFTATSAVCVTGLIVVDTATYFSPWGQAYLLLLIQLGGLGFITFTTLIIQLLGRRISLNQQSLAANQAEPQPEVDYARVARNIVLFTVTIEALGAGGLLLLWAPRMGVEPALWHAVFQAISAFCNAGFSTFSGSLVGFQHSVPTLLLMALLIIVGGIGFLTLQELNELRKSRRERRHFRISLHSRLALVTTVALLSVGFAGYLAFEWSVTLDGLALSEKAANAFFMSVTARTAGFNTVDYGRITGSASFLTIILMQIGGSPGSAAGGIKTTTLALILLSSVSRLRGLDRTHVSGRTIPATTIQRAVGLFAVAAIVAVVGVFVFTITEEPLVSHGETGGRFLILGFEVVSALNTVGLSMGATSGLSHFGRIVTIILMFVGRVGPLTMAAAMVRKKPAAADSYRYAYENLIVG